MTFYKTFFSNMLLFASLTISILFASNCGKQVEEQLNALLNIPEEITVDASTMEMTLRIVSNFSPAVTDLLELVSTGGTMVCEFSSISDRYVTVILPDNFSSGTYKIYVTRGSQRKLMGEAVIFIDYSSSTDIQLKDGNNVYGKVTCEGVPVPDVVISDGVQVVATDGEGVYQFKSDKVNGWVFVSVPSGYAVKKNGILPSFYSLFTMPAGTPEKVDFELVREDGQDNHTMIYMGDLHLADRNDDRLQFSRFTSEINSYLMANGGHKVYGITLGDMTWDLYWYSKNYCFSEYLNDISVISGMPIWHTIGNHDHDMNQEGDYDTVIKYKNSLGPTYFSFNIGQVHYVILDNIYCTNKGDGSRTYDDKITQEQLDWLKKDLAKVQTSTPVVVCMHAPIYSKTGSNSLNNASALENILLPYSTVHIFTGHSHRVHNIDKLASKHIFEHNAGAVCATWWWSAKLTPGIHIGQDGAPGGYEIVDVTGKDFKWTFKATGADENHQFRTYDRNCISLSGNSCIPNAFEANRTKFDEYAKDWKTASSSNEVYINIWDYDESWTVDVTENGKALKVERVSICDPLHLIAYTAPAMSNATKEVTPTFPTSANYHTFRVVASAPDTTLEIRVVDRFGNVYTESMSRPKVFTVENYKF